MKKLFCMTIVSAVLIACSSEVGPIETGSPTDPLRGLRGGDTALLSAGGSDAEVETDGGNAPPDLPDTGSAGSASVEPQDGGDPSDGSEVGPDAAGQDSGAQAATMLARELFVGTWSGQVLNGGHPCGDEITAETVDCSVGLLACGTQTVTIDTDYSIESDQGVEFQQWDGDVWVGGYDNDFQDDHRLLRLWLIDADTMLGESRSGTSTSTVCKPWKLTRQ